MFKNIFEMFNVMLEKGLPDLFWKEDVSEKPSIIFICLFIMKMQQTRLEVMSNRLFKLLWKGSCSPEGNSCFRLQDVSPFLSLYWLLEQSFAKGRIYLLPESDFSMFYYYVPLCLLGIPMILYVSFIAFLNTIMLKNKFFWL